MTNILSPRSDNRIIRWWLSIDRLSLGIIASLIIFGIVMVATASPSVATRIGLHEYHFLFRHILFLAPACALLLAATILNQSQILKAALALFIISIIGVVMSLIGGAEIKGARGGFV